jgi:hypothetical protein
MKELSEQNLRKRIQALLIFFIVALVISGITAFPLETELQFVTSVISRDTILFPWIERVYVAVKSTNLNYPFIAYGTDWLAFAHLVIAINFIGPLKEPVKNIWVLHFGVISCLCIIPLAFIAGAVREIPIYWRLIDCSFGIFGLLPLLLCIKYVRRLENIEHVKSLQYSKSPLKEAKIFEL